MAGGKLILIAQASEPAAMHPPPFHLGQRLSEWPDCRLELNCCRGQSFAEVLAKLRCQKCRKPRAPVYLCAGHRAFTMGAPADWAIELVPKV